MKVVKHTLSFSTFRVKKGNVRNSLICHFEDFDRNKVKLIFRVPTVVHYIDLSTTVAR